jgi:hypothetical protein
MNSAIILQRSKQFDLECVESVDLSGLPLHASGLRRPLLAQCIALREIVLRSCKLESLAGIDALEGTLVRLDVGNNSLISLAPCAVLSRLDELIVDNNKISGDALASIAPLVASLKVLDLRGNPSSAAAAPGNIDRTLALFPKLALLDGIPAAVQRYSVPGKVAVPKPLVIAAHSGAWLPDAAPPTPAFPPSKPGEQLEAAVRRFKLVAQRAEDALTKAQVPAPPQ